MLVIESFRTFIEILVSPFQSLFGFFPDFGEIIGGILVLSLGYFGWRAIK